MVTQFLRPTSKPSRIFRIRPVPKTFGVGILPEELPPVDVDRLCGARQAAQGFGMTTEETFAINAAGHATKVHVAGRHAESADDATFARLVEQAAQAARVEAAAAILRESPRSLVSFPRKTTAEATPAPKPAFTSTRPMAPTPEDRAWNLGYDLGRDGIDADPHRMTSVERAAFRAGHNAGLAAYHNDQRAEVEALIAAWEAEHAGQDDIHDWEYAEARMTRTPLYSEA